MRNGVATRAWLSRAFTARHTSALAERHRSRVGSDAHLDPTLGLVHEDADLHWIVQRLELAVPEHPRGQRLDLDLRHVRADADPRAPAEDHQGVRMLAILLTRWREPVGIEAPGILE